MLKELLKENIKELKDNTCLNISKIDFKDDEVIVLNRNDKVIFKDLIKNYDTTFESQKRFMLNVADKATSFLEVLEDLLEWIDEDLEDVEEFTFNHFINVDNVYYFDVIGKGDIYEDDTFISIDIDKLYEEYKKNEYYYISLHNFIKINENYRSFRKYIKDKLNYYIKEIKNKFKDKGVRVVAYHYDYYKIGFYVRAEMHKDGVCINYIKNSKNIYDGMTLYYSSIEDEKEANKVIEFIRKLIKN